MLNKLLIIDPCKPSASWITISQTQAETIIANFLAGDRTPTLEITTKAKEWLEDLVEWHLLQIASKPTHIEFHNQLFQEYYAAEWLAPQLEKFNDEELQYYYLNYLKWEENNFYSTLVQSVHIFKKIVLKNQESIETYRSTIRSKFRKLSK